MNCDKKGNPAFGGFSIGSKTAKKDMTEKTNNQIENEIVPPPS